MHAHGAANTNIIISMCRLLVDASKSKAATSTTTQSRLQQAPQPQAPKQGSFCMVHCMAPPRFDSQHESAPTSPPLAATSGSTSSATLRRSCWQCSSTGSLSSSCPTLASATWNLKLGSISVMMEDVAKEAKYGLWGARQGKRIETMMQTARRQYKDKLRSHTNTTPTARNRDGIPVVHLPAHVHAHACTCTKRL